MTLDSSGSENSLCLGLVQNDVDVPRAGFEPATTRSSAERSPRLSYLGNFWNDFGIFRERHRLNVSHVYLRFRRKIKLSFWQIYSKPTSSKALTASGFSITLTVNSSLVGSNKIFSMLM